ncbi:nuclear transport factor 2 family protein [Calothrix sp. 336/3]|uniref:nuclear transport factor 2 family protein n=1 Tax=Calothrix sp. 336/3 TaxID=1337936 RepID=UPI0004E37A25|nr:nuclear transport factor 2 family protein [Calothrix sp. 336/3]AKG24334.1 ketosteroid isomerase-like protein [Calothrix sp. 336/3]
MNQELDNSLNVANLAFLHFRHGLEMGEWQNFLDMLTDDFCFWFPLGKFAGLNVGKERAEEFFTYVSQVFHPGLKIIAVDRVTSNATKVVFEFRDAGLLLGEGYQNRVAVSFDIRGDQVCGYREYFGSDGRFKIEL